MSDIQQADSHGAPPLTKRQREVLRFIERSISERGFPPSVREICTDLGLASPSTAHTHLKALERLGYLRRDATKPRAMGISREAGSGAPVSHTHMRSIPLIGDVAAGTGVLAAENVEELVSLPAQFTGDGDLFMLRVRGDSMIDAGILDGDFVVVARQRVVNNGEMAVCGIPGDEATVKYFSRRGDRVTLTPANQRLEPMKFHSYEVEVFGRVVTVLRRL